MRIHHILLRGLGSITMDESGRLGILYPSSDATFFSGPTYVVPFPVEVEVTFIRSHEGKGDRTSLA